MPEVLDLDTGRIVPRVVFLDLDKGELEALQTDARNRPISDGKGSFLTYRAKGNFRVLPSPLPKTPDTSLLGAPHCARCRSPLTLQGQELCPFCKARDRGYRGFSVKKLVNPLLDRPCQFPGCNRLAKYSVSDEVSVSPVLGPDPFVKDYSRTRLYSRGAIVHRYWLCAWHYQTPRLLDEKGEVIRDLMESDGLRP